MSAAADRPEVMPLAITADGMKGEKGAPYFPDKDLIHAVNVALACDAPLLLTGQPGCGKTDFAWAVAGRLAARLDGEKDGRPLTCFARSDTRASDLLYHYDAVHRFGDVQLRAADAAAGPSRSPRLDVPEEDHPGAYIRLQALGKALVSQYRRVVLIDEIDKAPRDLPNDLLRTLEHYTFDIPEIAAEHPYIPPADARDRIPLYATMGPPPEKPLVIITSNEDRQLSEPFLRRCIFYHIPLPDETRLADILTSRFEEIEIGRNAQLRGRIVRIFLALRDSSLALAKRPSTAELIVWALALTRVFNPQHVDTMLARFDAALHPPTGVSPGNAPRWIDLPGLPCLIKTNEDLETLGRTSVGPRAA